MTMNKEQLREINSRAELAKGVARFIHGVNLDKYTLSELSGLSGCIEAIRAQMIFNPKPSDPK